MILACKKKHAKQTKKVGLGQTPPPSMGKIPTFYRFFFWRTSLNQPWFHRSSYPLPGLRSIVLPKSLPAKISVQHLYSCVFYRPDEHVDRFGYVLNEHCSVQSAQRIMFCLPCHLCLVNAYNRALPVRRQSRLLDCILNLQEHFK